MPKTRIRSFVVAAAIACLRSAVAAEAGGPTAAATPEHSLLPFVWPIGHSDSLLQYEKDETWSFSPDSSPKSTAVDGSAMTFSFVGSNFSIIGMADTSSDLALAVDGGDATPVPAPSGLILAEAHLPFGYHTATLNLVGGEVTIFGVNITTGMQTNCTSFENIPTRTQPFISENNRNKFYHLEGPWVTGSDARLAASPGGSFWANVPANTSYLAFRGSSQVATSYTISLEPSAPYGVTDVTLRTHPSASTGVLYMTPLDPTVKYRITFANSPNGTQLALHSMVFYRPTQSSDEPAANGTTSDSESAQPPEGPAAGSASETKSPANIGAIIGGSVGGGVALIIIALLFFLYRRNANRKAAKVLEEFTTPGKPYIPLPSGLNLHNRSQSVLGLGSFLEGMSSDQRRSALFEGSATAADVKDNKDDEAVVIHTQTKNS